MIRGKLRRGRLSRPGYRSPDQGSMPMALLISLVAMALSATLVPIVIDQIASTRTVTSRTQALQASQAGINVALGQLRSATVGTAGPGDLEALPPCDLSGASEPGWGYHVTIVYYRVAVDGSGVQTPQACPPFDVPVIARLSSTGGPVSPSKTAATLAAGDAGSRTVEATYTFRTSNENISGGEIQLADTTVNRLCMDAGPDASPAPGAPVKMQLCKAGGSSDQRFVYTPDLSIRLAGSQTATAPDGMCLDVPYGPAPRTAGVRVLFQPCLGLFARQQWSLNDSSNFSSTRETEVVLGDFCLNLLNPAAVGSDIVLGGCGGGADRRIFRPQPGVGAGMASVKTGQLVNFKQFSRCLDVTDFVPTRPYMIVWFCKQAPDGVIPWNQHWTLPVAAVAAATAKPERIRTAGSGNPGYCLRSPAVPNQYVTMDPCAATGTLTDPYLTWTVYGDTGNYATSYRIVDSFGYCLTPTDLTVPTPDTHTDGTAKVKVVACNNSELQKWNAPADFNKPRALSNTTEN